MDKCYNCGIELIVDIQDREHIPAQNMFVGYSDEYKKDRITVPACRHCNQGYSKIDHEVRDAIGINNEKNEQQSVLTGKSVRSIMRKKDWKGRVLLTDRGVEAVSFNYVAFEKYFAKDFKGVFYREFGYPLLKNYDINIPVASDRGYEVLKKHLLESDKEWKVSGHEDIFRYKIEPYGFAKNGQVIDSDVKDAITIASMLIYHKNLPAIVLATKRSWSEKILKASNRNA